MEPHCSVQMSRFNVELRGGKLEEVPCSCGSQIVAIAENSGEIALHHHVWLCLGTHSCIHDQVGSGKRAEAFDWKPCCVYGGISGSDSRPKVVRADYWAFQGCEPGKALVDTLMSHPACSRKLAFVAQDVAGKL